MNDTYYKIFCMIDWNQSIEIQEKGIELAENVEDIRIFMQPLSKEFNKNIWENCAKILHKKSDEELMPYLNLLLEWLEDLTWPGTLIIIDRLKKFSPKILLPYYLEAVNLIQKNCMEDNSWLDNLSILINSKDLADLLDENTRELLQKRYADFVR